MSKLAVGTKLANYVIEAKLGDGGMATVYRARHVHLESPHAIKVLNPELLVHAELRDRFLAEGRIQAQLRHPNIVAVTEVIAEPGVAGLVMEYIEGYPFDLYWQKAMANKAAGESELVRLFGQVLSAVQAAHDRGIVHRDLKPQNVLISVDKRGVATAKVLDFGIAKWAQDDRKGKTRTGAMMGTPAYMSPEQIRGAKEVSSASDIWSLGVMLYELMSGSMPFEGDTDFNTQMKIVNREWVPLRQAAPGCSAVMEAAVERALRVEVGERHASCDAFAAALHEEPNKAKVETAPPAREQAAPGFVPIETGSNDWPKGVYLLIVLSVGFTALVIVAGIANDSRLSSPPVQTMPVAQAPSGMAVIPGGMVTMNGASASTRVASFSIDVTEVTVDAYAACVRAGNCSASGLSQQYWGNQNQGGAEYCNWGKSDRGSHPVNCVDWNQAKAFCGWAQKRLPTEHEWQLAAESAQGRTYPWGEAAPSNQLCWDGEGNLLGKGNRQSTCAVGSFPSGDSAQGVKDLSGNVWEWTDSCYDSSCSARVIRGGSWRHGLASYVRAAYRDGSDPSDRSSNLGFRCSRSN